MQLTKEKVEEYIKDFSERSMKTLQDCNGHPMILVLITDKGAMLVELDPMIELHEKLYAAGLKDRAARLKDAIAWFIRKLAKKEGATGCALVNEAWVAKVKPSEAVMAYGDEPGKATALNAPLPRERADRQEAVSLTYEFKLDSGEKMSGMRTWVFHRDAAGKVIKIDPPEDRDNSKAIGRFVSFLE